MPRLSAEPIVLAAAHEQVLVRFVRAHTTPRKVAVCARMILLTTAGIGVGETARRLGVWPKIVRHWLQSWRNSTKATPVAQRLADAPRPGAPATFTPEQICAMVALACEQPAEQSDRPLSR
jgi:putative transposase